MSDNRPDVDLIFSAALELTSPEARAAYLQNACGPDLALRHRVERLLQAHASAGSFLGAPAAVGGNATIDAPGGGEGSLAERTLSEGPGTAIGPYRLLERIGEGGMGTVFMAEQTHPVRRKVALKIIKLGMDTRQVVARFEAERQALALMDHPNIAKVLDAGATEAGRPYFVMELVKGMPITEYCDQSHLATRQRLELFVQVCNAVQHAHQKGIIHRDLKPTNVLVTLHDDRPVPKVIDFGIAKATAQQLTEKTLFTNFGQMLGTPLYMSPEQAQLSGLDADTRSDVYSLGVLLYELLTGTTPFDRQRLGRAAYDEIRRIIREEEPPRPSTRLSTLGSELTTVSAHRGTSAKKLGQLVRGELDWIVMRAMEKDRTRRYDTANGLARDVERYLHNEPVSACPPSAAYRFRKFARRYRAPLSAAAVVAVALVAGVVVSSWQAVRATRAESLAQTRLEAEALAHQTAEDARERAEKERDRAVKAEQRAAGNFGKARSAITDYLAKVSDNELLKVPGMQPLRRELLTSALGFYQELLKEQADDAGLQAELADAYLRAGKIHAELGSNDDATMALREARARFELLSKANPADTALREGLAESLFHLNYDLEAAAIWEKLVQSQPGNSRFRQQLADTYNSRAIDAASGGDFAIAIDFHQKAIVIEESLLRDAPDDAEVHDALSSSLNNLAILMSQDDAEASLSMLKQAVHHSERAVELAPQVLGTSEPTPPLWTLRII